MMVVTFSDSDAVNINECGGKGRNLAIAAQSGFPVPPGFIVTTRAYVSAIDEVSAALHEAAGRADAILAQSIVAGVAMPPAIADDIARAYDSLGQPQVAVRSSATAEDLDDASFAGQQDTYLGVFGVEAVLDSVKQCWASLWTERAIDYRKQRGMDSDTVSIAVVVQTLIRPDTAGVLFTADPIGHSENMLVSSSYGLGESVVSGMVDPDSYTLRPKPFGVVSKTLGAKKTRIDATADGTETTSVPTDAQDADSLTDSQLRELAMLGRRVEQHFGQPQDIEWAFEGGELHLLQSRPITTNQNTVSRHGEAASRLEKTLRNDLVEHYPAPYPLDVVAVRAVQQAIQQAIADAGMTVPSAEQVIRSDDDGIITVHVAAPQLGVSTAWRAPALLWSAFRPPQHVGSVFSGHIADLRKRADQAESPDEAIRCVEHALALATEITSVRFRYTLAPMMVSRVVAARLIGVAGLSGSIAVDDVLDGVDYKTAVVTRRLEQLTNQARTAGLADLMGEVPADCLEAALADAPQSTDIIAAVDDFLDDCGARTPRMYLPFSNRSWGEDRTQVYATLAVMVQGNDVPSTEETDAVRAVAAKLPGPLEWVWYRAVRHLQETHTMREATLYAIEETYVVARHALGTLVDHLVKNGQLESADQAKYLYWGELKQAATQHDATSLQPVVDRRAARRGAAVATWWQTDDAPAGGAGVERAGAAGDGLSGVPGSPGQAVGRVRVVREPAEFHLVEPGDVLVCPFTDPTWTPLFRVVGAVVAETGGPLSHAAIVAREYGIPAVLGVQAATTMLTDGDEVLVDGTTGHVTPQQR